MNQINKEQMRAQLVWLKLEEIDPGEWEIIELPDKSFIIIQVEKMYAKKNTTTNKTLLYINRIPADELVNIYINADNYSIENNQLHYFYDTIEELMDSFFFIKLKMNKNGN